MPEEARKTEKPVDSSEIGDLERTRDERRRAVCSLTMSERLARVHEVSRQMAAIKGSARVH
jgi:hypothetical protein